MVVSPQMAQGTLFQCSGGTKLLKHQRIWWTNFETNLLGSSYFELPNKDWDGVHTNNAIHIIHIIHHQNLNLGLLDEKSWWLNIFSIQIVGGWCSFTTIFFLRFSNKHGNVLNVVWKPFAWGCFSCGFLGDTSKKCQTCGIIKRYDPVKCVDLGSKSRSVAHAEYAAAIVRTRTKNQWCKQERGGYNMMAMREHNWTNTKLDTNWIYTCRTPWKGASVDTSCTLKWLLETFQDRGDVSDIEKHPFFHNE